MAQWSPNSPLAHAVVTAGFFYDPQQDIIFSRKDALQRKLGYAYGYDDYAYLISAEIDCEPIFFDYRGKTWMIELWKGQYGLMTGCEIGIYNRSLKDSPPYYRFLDTVIGKRPDDQNPTHNLFFDCAGDDELLNMSFTLRRKGQKLLSRGPENHWWLTGFKWGELSSPDDLSMEVQIKFPNAEIEEAFRQALIALKYGFNVIGGDSVRFTFDQPKTFQPRRDLNKQAWFVQVRRMNGDIVSTYKQLRSGSNDPNLISGDLARKIADYITQYGGAFITQTLYNAITNAGAGFSGLIDSMEQRLGVRMDYSCRVKIGNVKNAYELIRGNFGVSPGLDGKPCGQYIVNPPEKIAPGGIAQFWMRDFPGFHGSEGWVEYYYMDSNRQKHSLRFDYGCPTGLYKNYARAQPPFTAWLREGDSKGWTKVPEQPLPGKVLHPLEVAFVID
jgi:hypothetical protein